MTDTQSTTARWTWWAAAALRWLTGPIFDKEMRVSSRRRRNYVLRFVYIGLFTFMATTLWMERVSNTASSGYTFVYQVSRMAAAGQTIITVVLWFQFLATQVIAVVMLSTSISDEIYKRTLGTLMTTPIGSFQIVMGKLASKLLQIVLLLAISLPLLAVVRVFGGVPWNYLLWGLCVTLTTVIFLGSLSLFFSIFTRRAYAAIIETVLAAGVLFGLVPLLLALLAIPRNAPSPPAWFQYVLFATNPYGMMIAATESLYSARTTFLASWPLHCGVMLGLSLLVLLAAMVLVRRAALRQALGGGAAFGGRTAEDGGRRGLLSTVLLSRAPASRRVVGPPVLWKERRIPLFGRRRLVAIIIGLVGLGLLILTYILCWGQNVLAAQGTHVAYGIVFFGLGLLFTTILPATCITTERESQTWPLLLTTTVDTWEILGGKFLGALRRCAPAWVLLFAHVAAFVLLGFIHSLALVQLAILVFWVLLFLTSTGLYFSTRLQHTTTAVIANMALAAALWALIPMVLGLCVALAKTSGNSLKVYMDLNPFVQAGVILNATAGSGTGTGRYYWIRGGMRGSSYDATSWLFLTVAVYVPMGFVFLLGAASRLRRNPF